MEGAHAVTGGWATCSQSPGWAAHCSRFGLSGRWRLALSAGASLAGGLKNPGGGVASPPPPRHPLSPAQTLRLRPALARRELLLQWCGVSPADGTTTSCQKPGVGPGALFPRPPQTCMEPPPVWGASSATRAAAPGGCFVLPALRPDQSRSLRGSPGSVLERGVRCPWRPGTVTTTEHVLPFGDASPRHGQLSPALEGAPARPRPRARGPRCLHRGSGCPSLRGAHVPPFGAHGFPQGP